MTRIGPPGPWSGGGGGGPAVVNDQVKSAASALPAESLIPVGPDFSVAVYAVEKASEEDGSSVTFSVPASQATLAATAAPPGPRSVNVEVPTVAESSGSLKVAVRFADAATAGAPEAGDTETTVGGVESVPPEVENTTSTQ